jgi:hypothetical protein
MDIFFWGGTLCEGRGRGDLRVGLGVGSGVGSGVGLGVGLGAKSEGKIDLRH